MNRMLLVAVAGLISFAGAAHATRPMTIDDADPTDVGSCQLTAGASLAHTGAIQDWNNPVGLACGVVSNLDLEAGFGAQRLSLDDAPRRHEYGCSDLLLGAKWQFLQESDWLPRQTLEPFAKIPTASHNQELGSGRPDYDLTWVASKKLTDNWQVDLNLGYTQVGHPKDDPEDNRLHGGLALEYQISPAWQWVGELFGQRDLRGNGETIVQDSTGLRWQVGDGLTLDAAIGSGLRGEDAPHLTATLGLSWVFGISK